MKTMLTGLMAAALLGGTAGMAQAQDMTMPPPAPGTATPADPTMPQTAPLPTPTDPLDPNAPATTPPPTTTQPLPTDPMNPAAPPGTVPPAPPPEDEDGTDVIDDNHVGPDDMGQPMPEDGAPDPAADDRLTPDPTQPPL